MFIPMWLSTSQNTWDMKGRRNENSK